MAPLSPQTLEAVLAECAKPGYKFTVSHSRHSSSIDIKVSNLAANTFQLLTITDEFIEHLNGQPDPVDKILDWITIHTCGLSLTPLYIRIFNQHMYDILYTEFVPGELWG